MFVKSQYLSDELIQQTSTIFSDDETLSLANGHVEMSLLMC